MNAAKEEKFTLSAGRLFHTLMTLTAKYEQMSNWRPAGRIRPAGQVDAAREAKLDFLILLKIMLAIIQ